MEPTELDKAQKALAEAEANVRRILSRSMKALYDAGFRFDGPINNPVRLEVYREIEATRAGGGGTVPPPLAPTG